MRRREAIEIKYLQGQPRGPRAACGALRPKKWSICPRGPCIRTAAVWLNGYEWPIKKMFGTTIKMNHLLLLRACTDERNRNAARSIIVIARGKFTFLIWPQRRVLWSRTESRTAARLKRIDSRPFSGKFFSQTTARGRSLTSQESAGSGEL